MYQHIYGGYSRQTSEVQPTDLGGTADRPRGLQPTDVGSTADRPRGYSRQTPRVHLTDPRTRRPGRTEKLTNDCDPRNRQAGRDGSVQIKQQCETANVPLTAISIMPAYHSNVTWIKFSHAGTAEWTITDAACCTHVRNGRSNLQHVTSKYMRICLAKIKKTNNRLIACMNNVRNSLQENRHTAVSSYAIITKVKRQCRVGLLDLRGLHDNSANSL